MASEKATINYEEEEDILYIKRYGSIRDSLQIGNYIIDFSRSDQIIGIEIMDISKSLPDNKLTTKKEFLNNITDARIVVRDFKNLISVSVIMKAELRNKELSHTLTIPIPESVVQHI